MGRFVKGKEHAMNCTICGRKVVLVPSANERAIKFGGKPSDYTRLFTTHAECALRKLADDTTELMRRERGGKMSKTMKTYTVIGHYVDNGQLFCIHTTATHGLHAFSKAATEIEGPAEFSVAILGELDESRGRLTFPGEGLVDETTVRNQPEVFGPEVFGGANMSTFWTGPDDRLTEGLVGFLIKYHHHQEGRTYYEVNDLPAHTNQSGQPTLRGWCGSYNNLSTYGCGMVRVVRLAKNGRALVEELEGAELTAALEEFGYPELNEEEPT